jgi:Holliday junction resolvase
MQESEIQKQIVEYLKNRGYFVIRNYLGPVHYHGAKTRPNPNSGMPDLMCIKAGLTHFIEIKTAKGKLSPKQIAWHSRAYEAGIIVHVFRSLDDCLQIF